MEADGRLNDRSRSKSLDSQEKLKAQITGGGGAPGRS